MVDLSRPSLGSGARLRQTPRGGLLVAAIALGVVVAVIAWLESGTEPPPPPSPLTAAELATYLEVAPTIHAERRTARAEGRPPSTWSERPGFRDALEAASWTLGDFLRVEGQVTAARLRVEDPALFAAEFQEHDAPAQAVRLVEEQLEAIRQVQSR